MHISHETGKIERYIFTLWLHDFTLDTKDSKIIKDYNLCYDIFFHSFTEDQLTTDLFVQI